MKIKTGLSLLFVVGLLFFSVRSDAQVFWDYSVSDGVNTMTGSFTTSGSFEDTQGSGENGFRVDSWDAWFLNGVNLSGQFSGGNPRIPGAGGFGYDSFLWSRDGQRVVGLPDGSITGSDSDPFVQNSSVWISLPGEGASGYRDHVNSNSIVNVSFDATSVEFTPSAVATVVPEPSTYCLLTAFLVGGFVCLRRARITSVQTANSAIFST